MKAFGTLVVAILVLWFIIDFDTFQSFVYSAAGHLVEVVEGLGGFLEQRVAQ